MTIPYLKDIKSFYSKEKHRIYIIGILIVWAAVIFLKYGGQSLLIHYLWPFIIFGSLILLLNKNWFKNNFGWLHILALLSLAFFLLTFLTDLTPSNGSLELMNFTGGILLAIVLSQIKWDNSVLGFLFLGLIFIVFIADIWGILSYATGHPFTRLVGPLIKPYEAFSGYPNLAANLNLIALLPAFYIFIQNKKNLLTKGSIFLINVVILTSLILTYSRAAWISALLVINIAGIVFLIKFRKERKLILKYILSALGIVFVSFLVVLSVNFIRNSIEQTASIQEKITFQSEDEGSSVIERIASIQRGTDMAISYPLTGVGSGSFNYISQSYEEDFETLSSYPYSLPIKLLAENGPFFSFIVIFWIISLIVISLKTNSKYPLIATLTIIILLIHHSLDNNFDFFAASFPFFILLGIIWPKLSKKTIIKNNLLVLIVVILSLSGIVFAFHEAWYGRYYIQGRNAAGAGLHEDGYNLYSKAEKLIFPRDAKLAASLSAWEIYNETSEQKWLTNSKIKVLDYINYDNPLDIRGGLLLAKIALEEEKYEECLDWTQKAYEIGGDNYFEMDYYELMCLTGLGKTREVDQFASKIKPKLEIYLELLKVNAHMTILTDNPKFAVKILELLRKDRYDEFEGLYEEMYVTAKEELEKFHKKYGVEAEVDYL